MDSQRAFGGFLGRRGSGLRGRGGQDGRRGRGLPRTAAGFVCLRVNCGAIFARRSQLDDRENIHRGLRPHAFRHCDFRRSDRSNLRRHVARYHGGVVHRRGAPRVIQANNLKVAEEDIEGESDGEGDGSGDDSDTSVGTMVSVPDLDVFIGASSVSDLSSVALTQVAVMPSIAAPPVQVPGPSSVPLSGDGVADISGSSSFV